MSRVAFLLLIAAALSWTGCSGSGGGRVTTDGFTALIEDDTSSQEQDDASVADPPQLEEELYVVVQMNTEKSTLRLFNIERNRQEDYVYNDGTRFLNRYGKTVSSAQFMPGKIVQFEQYGKTGELRAVQLSSGAWEYDGVRRFSADEDRRIFQIADTKYYYEDDLHVFSEEDMITLDDIGENDILRVQGVGRKILTLAITSGHGVVQLANTDLFEGGWLSLSDRMYYRITEDMQLEIREGTYQLSVANRGYGDTKEIEVKRGETTVVNLDELKGEGPKFCKVTFEVGADNAVMTLDGEKIDYTQPQEVAYGIHRLEIVAEGYEKWSKRLYVNSKEATIQVAMTSDDGTVLESVSEEGTQLQTEMQQQPETQQPAGTQQLPGMQQPSGTEKIYATERDTQTDARPETEHAPDTQAGSAAGSQAGSHAGSMTQQFSSEQTAPTEQSAETSSEDSSTEKASVWDKVLEETRNSYIRKLMETIMGL